MRDGRCSGPKFDRAGFQPDADGLPFLKDVRISLRCATCSKVDGGDDLVLIGWAEEAGLGEEMPFVCFRRKFHSLPVSEDTAVPAPSRQQPRS